MPVHENGQTFMRTHEDELERDFRQFFIDKCPHFESHLGDTVWSGEQWKIELGDHAFILGEDSPEWAYEHLLGEYQSKVTFGDWMRNDDEWLMVGDLLGMRETYGYPKDTFEFTRECATGWWLAAAMDNPNAYLYL